MTDIGSEGGSAAVVAALEAARGVLGDAATDAAIAAVRAAQATKPPTAEPVEHEEERKLVSVMFADASGFTALSEKLGAEQVRTLMNDCFSVLAPVIERHGGTIDKYIGDCIMSLFGAPVTREDDAQRCVGAALDMLDALAAFNSANGTTIGMHIGINTGEVIAGGVGGAGRQDYSVIGDAVNIAARLQDVAKTGEIFVGPETVRLAGSGFAFELVSTIQLKGRVQPVAVYRLLGRRVAVEQDAGVAVGRDAEVARITAALALGMVMPPRRLLVSGEPGIGKTQLLTEARRGAGPEIAFVFARAQASSMGTPYAPIANSLARLSGSPVEAGSAVFAANLLAACQAQAGDGADALFGPLALLSGLPVGLDVTRAFAGMAPDLLPARFAEAYLRFARGAVAAQRLALCFEDLHWADSATLALIARLPAAATPPALILMSARTGAVSALGAAGIGWDEELRLPGLPATAIAQLTGMTLGVKRVGPGLLALLSTRSEGNPFFLEQLLVALRDADGIEVADGVAELRRATTDIRLPASLHGLIQARLDQLSRPAKRTLQAAAAVGRTFPVRLIELVEEQAGATAAETDGRLADLAARDLLRAGMTETRALPWPQYAFRHAAIQEVAYNTLLEAPKRRIHRAIAETLEALFGAADPGFYQTRADHYRHAGEDAKAAALYLDAAERAAAIYAADEARGAFRHALDALDRIDAGSDAATRPQRVRALTGLGRLQERAGEHAEAGAAFRAALALCDADEPVVAAGLHRQLGLSATAQRDLADAARAFDEALALLGPPRADADPEWWCEWIEVQLERLWAAYFLGDLAAMQTVRETAGELVARHGSLSQRSRFGKRVLLIAFREERLNISDATMTGARASLVLSEELGDPDDLARAHFMVGFCAMWRGDLAVAQDHLPRGLELATMTGNTEYRVMSASYLTVLHRMRGDTAAVDDWCATAEPMADAAEMPLYGAIARANRAWLALRRGDAAAVESLAAPIVAVWAAAPFPLLAWLAAWPLLAARLDRGEGDLAAPLAAMLRANQQQQGAELDDLLREAARLTGQGDCAAAMTTLAAARPAAALSGYC